MATIPEPVDDAGGVTFVDLTPEEAWAEFDAEVRTRLGIGAADFARRYDAGEYDDPDDDPVVRTLAFDYEGLRHNGCR